MPVCFRRCYALTPVLWDGALLCARTYCQHCRGQLSAVHVLLYPDLCNHAFWIPHNGITLETSSHHASDDMYMTFATLVHYSAP
jgi:hypothetical protein